MHTEINDYANACRLRERQYAAYDRCAKKPRMNMPEFAIHVYAIRILHENGIRTTCFISPIFPEITDVRAIIERVKEYCNLIWLENLNLRGDYKAVILRYIKRRYSYLYPLYAEIYNGGNMGYWQRLDEELKTYIEQIGLEYVTNDDSMIRPFDAPPIVVNFFYHEKIKRSARSD